MGRLLIVSPRFPPKNAPDLHRVRTSLAHYRSCGWAPTVLCIDPATSDGVDDPLLAETLSTDIAVMRVPAWRERTCRYFGFGQLGYRCLLPLFFAGSRLLRRERHDVVFFSTTVFLSFVLGPLWKWRYGCRLVYDFQDPWYSEKKLYTRKTVPGRWWKYRLDQSLAWLLEKFTLRQADHIIAVSDAYVADLSRRHRHLNNRGKFTVLPFGGAPVDHALVQARAIAPAALGRDEGMVHWVSAGRAGADMAPVIAVLFEKLALLRREDLGFTARMRLHFVGTNYADNPAELVQPLARDAGVDDLVREIPRRQPYFETLSLYQASDAILLIGSVHADYTASKLLPCVLSKKPILALVHRGSLLADMAAQFANIYLATFVKSPTEPDFGRHVSAGLRWLQAPIFDAAAIDEQVQPWLAEALTRRQCAVFDQVAAEAITKQQIVRQTS